MCARARDKGNREGSSPIGFPDGDVIEEGSYITKRASGECMCEEIGAPAVYLLEDEGPTCVAGCFVHEFGPL